MSYMFVDSFRAGPGWNCTGASSWFYYKEICYDAWSHERKKIIFILVRVKFFYHSESRRHN